MGRDARPVAQDAGREELIHMIERGLRQFVVGDALRHAGMLVGVFGAWRGLRSCHDQVLLLDQKAPPIGSHKVRLSTVKSHVT